LFFFTISGSAYGQNLKENELVVIQGERFILHQVRTGETIYSISRDFKIDSSQLLKNNPKISEGLSIGEILKIPFNEDVDLTVMPNYKKGDPSGFINHSVESNNETAYSISKKYGITVEEVYAYNPTVQRLKKGVILKIPQWQFEQKVEKKETGQVQTPVSNQNVNSVILEEHTVVSGETLYSIGKKYHLTESEILSKNPDAKNLKAGTILYLPQNVAEKSEVGANLDNNVQGKYLLHKVESGESIYGITKKYNVSEDELKTINPELKTAFRAGTEIRIPINENAAVIIEPNTENTKDSHENQKLSLAVTYHFFWMPTNN